MMECWKIGMLRRFEIIMNFIPNFLPVPQVGAILACWQAHSELVERRLL